MPFLLDFEHVLRVLQTITSFSTLSIFLLLLCIALFFLRNPTKSNKLNLPPSPPRLPIIGNLHQLGSLPHRSLQTLSRKHGPIMFMHFGHSPTLVISSAKLAKEMTKEHDVAFSNRVNTLVSSTLLYKGLDIVFSPYGEYWRQARKACVYELLSNKRVQSFQFVRDEEVAASVDTIRRSCTGTNGVSVNLTEVLLALSSNIISRCVLGEKYDDRNFGELSRKLLAHFESFSFGDFFPSLGWLDVVTGLTRKLKETFDQFDSFFDRVIDEHKVSIDNEKAKTDFVDILVKLQRNGFLEFELTKESIKAILLDMIVGGIGTTTTTVEWAMAELLKHPAALKKVQEEVRNVVSGKSKIDQSHINQMAYLKCVIKESLRLHAPVPFLIPRETSTSLKLGGYDIPSKTSVLVNVWAIQRDPEHWEDADGFVPERFEKKNAADFTGQDFEFLPFGMGRRGCPGISFGVASAECQMANILHWFDWKLPAGTSMEDLDMSEANGLTVQKKVPLFLVPTMYTP